jgi:hypothetical protein
MAGDDPDAVFAALVDGLSIPEPSEDLIYTSEHLESLTKQELLDMWVAVEEALIESDELLLPKSEWAQDTHNLRFSLRREMTRRNIAF